MSGSPEPARGGPGPAAPVGRQIDLSSSGRVSIRTGKVELGQGIVSALAHIAASALCVSVSRIVMIPADTDESPDEGTTSGSESVSHAGMSLRQACAETRSLMVERAAQAAQVPAESLRVRDGSIVDTENRVVTTYWLLAGSGDPPDPIHHLDPTEPGARLDLPGKIMGGHRYIQDLRVEGQLFGRVVRPPSLGSHLLQLPPRLGARDDLAESEIVRVVRRGDFLGVVCSREETAVRAAVHLRAQVSWSDGPPLPPLPTDGRCPVDAEGIVIHQHGVDDLPAGDELISATYSRSYLAHASIGTSSALASWDGQRLTVWSHSQGIFNLRRALALALAMPENDITVRHVENAGCYGHNGADDAAFDAALLALCTGRPVQVTWSREDELAWSPLGSAMTVHLQATLDDAGRISSWRHEACSQGHSSRPGASGHPRLLGHALMLRADALPDAVDPPLTAGFGGGRNAIPIYDSPRCRVLTRLMSGVPVRTSSLRSLGSHCNTFAIESFMDELAAAADVDPVEFRLRHLTDPRARDVLEQVAEMASWSSPPAAEGVGLGVGVSRYKGTGAYCAVVAQVEAIDHLRVQRLFVAVDVGEVISLDGVVNQIEGGAIQAVSWTLREEVRFDGKAVSSRDWDQYPILRFPDVPAVDVRVLHRKEPSAGAGEAAMGPTSAAIANGLRAVLGVAIRDLPLTDQRIESSLSAR